MTLTRRDRAAMVLALEALRRSPHPSPLNSTAVRLLVEADAVLDHCDDLSPLADALPAHRYPAGMARVIRARFALWIRAVLRADAGDCGMVACPVCGFVGDGSHERGDPCGLCWQRQICPIPRMTWGSTRPLWESAPPTRARAR